MRTVGTGRSLMPILCIAIAVLSAYTAPVTGTSIEHYVGSVRDLSGHVLYTESHWISETAGARELLVLFVCPDGQPFARKEVRETDVKQAPSFTLEDGRTGYREGVRDGAGVAREVFVRTAEDEPEKSASLLSTPGLVIDAGFDDFIREHWERLATGARQHLDFLVPGRLRTYPFTLSLVDDELVDGKPVRRFLLELDTWYGFAIPPIVITYAVDSRTIRDYQGVANVRDAHGKTMTVRIQFAAGDRRTSDESRALADAKAAHLEGACVL